MTVLPCQHQYSVWSKYIYTSNFSHSIKCEVAFTFILVCTFDCMLYKELQWIFEYWSYIHWLFLSFKDRIDFSHRQSYFLEVYFLTIWLPHIYFDSFIVEARSTGTMLNKSGENGYPCIVPDIRGKEFNLSPLSMMLVVGFHRCPFLVWGNSFLILVFWEFYLLIKSEVDVGFVKSFFRTHIVTFFTSLIQ